jgi:hypothetical protein
VAADFRLRPDPHEVAEVFEMPLAAALDPDNRHLEDVQLHGRDLQYYVIDWQGYRIWGATAAMLVGLSETMKIPK